MPLQAPVRYGVTTFPTRAGRYKPPYAIINLSTESTLWCADNAGLQVGQGTPIFPGTSLEWTQEGELWIVGEGAAEVLISYDVQNWTNPAAIAVAILNSGVLIIDDPIALTPPGTILAPGGTISAEVSTYQSLILTVAGVAGNTAISELLISYPSTGNIKRISLAANGLGWSGVLPLLGEDLVITANNGGANIQQAVLSHRPYVNSYQRIFGSAPTFYLTRQSVFVANAASVGIPSIRPIFGDVQIDIFALLSAAPAAENGSQVSIADSGGNVIQVYGFENALPGLPLNTHQYRRVIARIPNQGDQWSMNIFNGYPAPITLTAQVHVNPVESTVG